MGNAYGAEGIWYHNRDGQTWQTSVEYESSKDITRMKEFVDGIKWWKMQPDINHEFLIGGYGDYMTDNYALATVADDRSFVVVYTPVKHILELNLSTLGKKWKMRWFDPTNGMFFKVKKTEYRKEPGKVIITSPGKNSTEYTDWILIVEKRLR